MPLSAPAAGFVRYIQNALEGRTPDPPGATDGGVFTPEPFRMPGTLLQLFDENELDVLARKAWLERLSCWAATPQLLGPLTKAVAGYQSERIVWLPRDTVQFGLSRLAGIYSLATYCAACHVAEDGAPYGSRSPGAEFDAMQKEIDDLLARVAPADAIALHLLCQGFGRFVSQLDAWHASWTRATEGDRRRQDAADLHKELLLRSPMTRLMGGASVQDLRPDPLNAPKLGAVLGCDHADGLRRHLVQELMAACHPADKVWQEEAIAYAAYALHTVMKEAESEPSEDGKWRMRLFALLFFKMFAFAVDQPGEMQALQTAVPGDPDKFKGFEDALARVKAAGRGASDQRAAQEYQAEYAEFHRVSRGEKRVKEVSRHLTRVTLVKVDVAEAYREGGACDA